MPQTIRETRNPERSCCDLISVKSSKGIVGEREQKHLLKWQSFPCASAVHIRFYISVRTHTKRTFRTNKRPSWSWSMVVGFTTTCVISAYSQVVCSNPVHGEVYSTQHYVIQFVQNDFHQTNIYHFACISGVRHHKLNL
jgi:hypothetical protein